MLEIMKYLTTELKKFSPRVFNDNANTNAIFPYVVFSINTSSIIEKNREDIIVEIDIWDYQKDNYDATVNTELLTDRIDKFLRNVRHNGEKSVFIFEKIGRLNLPDEDGNVKRRQLRYVVKYYDKNQ